MENEQAREWAEAQKITFSVDLVEAAKNHLKFLAAVDRNRFLYEDHVLKRAIYRYNAFWLPLLAKHVENPVSEGPLVVPLDIEWVWHCHRLNPIRYKLDCEKLYGRTLGNQKVISSVQATSKSATEQIWSQMYTEEPYELDFNRPFPGDVLEKSALTEKFTSYDLISAVKRQMPFTFQICRPYTTDDLFLQEAVGRYKAFLHLIRTNDEKKRVCFCVPTYDVDLMWHTHQLYPESYCKDLIETVGKVLHHNDNVSDRSPGKLLHSGFSETIKQWEETFGRRYRKAGTLYHGSSPTPVTEVPLKSNNVEGKDFRALESCSIPFPSGKAVEVVLEFGEIKNLPAEHKGNLIVLFSKTQPDKLFNTKRSLSLSSESGENKVASFKCEPTGEFLFELMSYSPVSGELKPNRSLKLLGSCSLALQELTSSESQLSVDKWLTVKPVSGLLSSEPIALHASVSFTPSMPAPQVFQLVRSQPFSKAKHANIPTKVRDLDGKDVFSLQMRNIVKDTTKPAPDLSKEVYCITDSGEKHVLAEFKGHSWSIKGSHGSFKLQNNSGIDDTLQLVGNKMVKLFRGRRLDFETISLENQKLEQGFVTVVEFSAQNPYGKAVALLDLKSETIKAIDEWIVLPGITLSFIFSAILRGEMDCGKGNVMDSVFSKSDGSEGDFNAESNVVNGGGKCGGECCTGWVHIGNMVKSGVVVSGGGGGGGASECGVDCFHCTNMAKNGGVVSGGGCAIGGCLAENGGVVSGGGCAIGGGLVSNAPDSTNMVENGVLVNGVGGGSDCGQGCGHATNMVKNGVVAIGGGLSENGGVVSGGGCAIGGGLVSNAPDSTNMVENGVLVNGVGGGSDCGQGCGHATNMVKNGGVVSGGGCAIGGGLVSNAPDSTNMVENVLVSGDGGGSDCGGSECGQGCGHATNMVKSGVVVSGAGYSFIGGGGGAAAGSDCGQGCGHSTNMAKNGVGVNGSGYSSVIEEDVAMGNEGEFADCAKCYRCGVQAGKYGGDNEDVLAKIGEFVNGDNKNGNGGARCNYDGGRCLVMAQENEGADSAKCYHKNGGDNEDMVAKNGDNKNGNGGARWNYDGGRCLVMAQA